MRRVHGEEVCAPTRGGLIGTLYSCGNRLRKRPLNDQKSAEAIVPVILENREGLNHVRRMTTLRTYHLMKQKHENLPSGGCGESRGGR
ncbi:hypothetical protein [Alteribacillus iranensis]|uniref:hypothetical protein n=1 Tax=Alteribacillus iranensis TaxID=930128 RepID=UPI001160C6DA|nr:hypothetical protein [Alteribacillus iranensis]